MKSNFVKQFIIILVVFATSLPMKTLSADLPQTKTLKVLEITSAKPDDLKKSKIEVRKLGDIDLPTGGIVAADALTLFVDKKPTFTQAVLPGNYSVYTYIVDDKTWGARIALAELRFSEGNVVRWQAAVTSEQHTGSLEKDSYFGYGVDAGLGSFMSLEAFEAYRLEMKKTENDPQFNYYDDVLKQHLEKVVPSTYIYGTKSTPSHGVAIFASGFGDGYYPSYFGYGKDGQPVKLVTTFFVLEESEED